MELQNLVKEILVASILIGLFSAMIQANFAGLVLNNQSLTNTTPDLTYKSLYYMVGAGPNGTNLVISWPLYVAYSNMGYLVAVGLFLALLAVCLKQFK
jgi:hypothetical protein